MNIHPIVIHLIAVNLTAFILFGVDKLAARNDRRRIAERRLLFFAVIGGAAGAFAAMKLFHHKTRKKLFSIGVPILLVFQAVAICLWAVSNTGII